MSHIHFPEKQVRMKGIPHVGIKGKWVGKCKCGQVLEFINNNVHHGWFTTDSKDVIERLTNDTK